MEGTPRASPHHARKPHCYCIVIAIYPTCRTSYTVHAIRAGMGHGGGRGRGPHQCQRSLAGLLVRL